MTKNNPSPLRGVNDVKQHLPPFLGEQVALKAELIQHQREIEGKINDAFAKKLKEKVEQIKVFVQEGWLKSDGGAYGEIEGLKRLLSWFSEQASGEEKRAARIQFPTFNPHSVVEARFPDIESALTTRVAVSGNLPLLSANTINFNGQKLAIACQYPMEKQRESHFAMVQRNAVALVILASEEDMKNRGASNYLHDQVYDSIAVKATAEEKEEILTGLNVMKSQLNIYSFTDTQSPIAVPVLRVPDWLDRTSLPSDQLIALAQRIIDVSLTQSHGQNSFPVIHCMGGVGRTGQIIAVMQMLRQQHKPNKLSLREIIQQMREQRSYLMVQTLEQLDTLLEVASRLGTPYRICTTVP